jgi:hypothetical protein
MPKRNKFANLKIIMVLLCLLLSNILTGCGETPPNSPKSKPTPKPTLKSTPKPTLKTTPKPTLSPTLKPTLKPGQTPTPVLNPTPTPSPSPKPTATPSPLSLMEWYKYRQDKEMTGYSQGSASMVNAPLLDWSSDIAGWQGYLLVKQCINNSDYEALPYHNAVDVNYYENNKYNWGLGTPRYDLNGTGKLVPVTDNPAVKVADFIKDRPGLEKAVIDNYYQVGDQARARLYSYSSGYEQLVWTSDAFPTCYGPVACCADADNDGQLDLIIAMHYRLVVLNGATGATIFNYTYNDQRNYGFLGAANIDSDPYPEFCVISDFAQHIEVIDNNGSSLSVKWFIKIEDSIYQNAKITQPGPDSFVDLDHDGQIEVVCNIYNYQNDQHWSIIIFNALTGAVKYKLENCYLRGMVDINHDGYQELFITMTAGAEIPTYGELRICQVIPDIGSKPLWTYQNARFHVRNLDSLPLTVNTMAANGRSAIVHGQINQGLPDIFLVSEPGRQNGEICSCFGFDESNQVRNWMTVYGPENSTLDAVAVAGTDSNINDTGILMQITTQGAPGEQLTVRNGTAKLKQWSRKTPLIAGPPVAADLENDGVVEIITSTSDQVITCFEAPRVNGNPYPQIRWRMKGQGMTADASNTQDGVLIADLDQDSQKEVIFARESPDGNASIVVVRPNGSLAWQRVFPGFDGSPPVWNLGGITYWLAANFTSPNHQDLYVSIRRGKMHSDVGFLLDGRDGRIIWQQDGILLMGGDPILDKRGHGGDRVAATDMDNDGLDELVCDYPDRVYIVEGQSGYPSIIKSTAWSLFPGLWTAYAVPVLMSLQGKAIPEILYGRSGYLTALLNKSCNLVWKRDFNADGNNGCDYLQGIGDCDNDDRLEIGGIYRNSTTGQYEFRFYKGNTGENLSANASIITGQSNFKISQEESVAGNYSDKLMADLERVYLGIHQISKTTGNQTANSTGKLNISNLDYSCGVFSLQGLGIPCTDIVTADLDGDHCAEFLFGIGNSLQCINSQGLKWNVNTGGIPGEIVLADVDRDGKLEIAVCTRDGYLKVYQ